MKFIQKYFFFFFLGVVFIPGCYFFFGWMQELKNNPMDLLYYSKEGRLILAEPLIINKAPITVRVYWKPVTSDTLIADWSFTVYSFGAGNLENVIQALNKGLDPTGYLTPFTTQPVIK